MSLPAEIIPLFEAFRPVFTEPTYRKVMVLLIGTMLARGRRTVTAALRAVGKEEEGEWSKYHHVLNRNKWEGLCLSRILLHLIVKRFVAEGGIIYVTVDETLERRWGPQIRKRGHWRDSLASYVVAGQNLCGIREFLIDNPCKSCTDFMCFHTRGIVQLLRGLSIRGR